MSAAAEPCDGAMLNLFSSTSSSLSAALSARSFSMAALHQMRDSAHPQGRRHAGRAPWDSTPADEKAADLLGLFGLSTHRCLNSTCCTSHMLLPPSSAAAGFSVAKQGSSVHNTTATICQVEDCSRFNNRDASSCRAIMAGMDPDQAHGMRTAGGCHDAWPRADACRSKVCG